MNQAYFHTSYTLTQFANHSSRTTTVNRDPEIRTRRRKPEQSGASSSRGVRRYDGLPVPLPAGRLSPLSPDIQLPPSLTLALVGIYFSGSNRTATGDGGSWSILILWRPEPPWAEDGSGLGTNRAILVHRHRLSLNAEEYSMVVILRMNRAFIGVHAQAREGL